MVSVLYCALSDIYSEISHTALFLFPVILVFGSERKLSEVMSVDHRNSLALCSRELYSFPVNSVMALEGVSCFTSYLLMDPGSCSLSVSGRSEYLLTADSQQSLV